MGAIKAIKVQINVLSRQKKNTFNSIHGTSHGLLKTESASLHPQKHGGVPRRDVLDGVHEVAGGAPVV